MGARWRSHECANPHTEGAFNLCYGDDKDTVLGNRAPRYERAAARLTLSSNDAASECRHWKTTRRTKSNFAVEGSRATWSTLARNYRIPAFGLALAGTPLGDPTSRVREAET